MPPSRQGQTAGENGEFFCGLFEVGCYIPSPLREETHASTGVARPAAAIPGLTLFRVVTTKHKTTKPAHPRGASRGSTSAAAILGHATASKSPAAAPVKIRPQWARYYERLLDLRDQLLRQMSGLAKESAQEMPGYSLHMADSGTDNFDRDFALSLLSSDQDAVYEIEAALKRIEKGTYGVCELTGKPIPHARLEAIPWTRYTVEAQAQLEREGAARRRRLGALGSIDSVAVPDVEEEEEPDDKVKEKE